MASARLARSLAALATSPGLASSSSAPVFSTRGPLGVEIRRALVGSSPFLARERWAASPRPGQAASAPPPLPPAGGGYEKRVLYRGKGMPALRALVRLKVSHLAGVASGGWLLAGLAQDASASQLAAAGGLSLGAVGASLALWFFSRRYVGELALLIPLEGPAGAPAGGPASARGWGDASSAAAAPFEPPPLSSRVRFSVLDFWGNRLDEDRPLDDVLPPAPPGTPRAALARGLLPLEVLGDRQYLLSLGLGRVVDRPTLEWLLTRSLAAEAGREQGGRA